MVARKRTDDVDEGWQRVYKVVLWLKCDSAAVSQVGHAVCASLTSGHDPVQKVTLIPRGQARGLTWFTPDEDPSLISKQQIMARIVGALGGRAAEQIIFGTPEVTTGASSDLQQV